MKKIILLLVALSASLPARAQVFSSESLGNAALGGLLGGIIGHNSGRKTAEGIGIGAGAGLLLGALRSNHRNRGSYDSYIPSQRQSAYATGGRVQTRPNYAVTGAALGGLAGGIIGHNNGRKTAEGIGIGAASGLILGGLAEGAARRSERPHYYAQPAHPTQYSSFYANQPVGRQSTLQPVTTRTATPSTVITTTQTPVSGSTLVTRIPAESRVQTATTGIRQMSTHRGTTRPASGQQPIKAQTVIINNYYGSNSGLGSANRMFGR
ncbi:MAG: outer membrane lipoprotein SlyB [Limisphaerales bacterium]|jgi:outer membrane lipoprotein SlyB